MQNQDSHVSANMNFPRALSLVTSWLKGTLSSIVVIESEISLLLCQQNGHLNRTMENHTTELMLQKNNTVALNALGLTTVIRDLFGLICE